MRTLLFWLLIAGLATPATSQTASGWDDRFLPPGPGDVTSVAIVGEKVFAVGPDGLEVWDPAHEAWTRVEGFEEQEIHDLAAHGDSVLFVAGAFRREDGVRNLARWSLRTDSWIGTGLPETPEVRAIDVSPEGLVTAVWDHPGSSAPRHSNVARWNPSISTWRAVGRTDPSRNLRKVIVRGDSIWVATAHSSNRPGLGLTGVWMWDGLRWTILAHSNEPITAIALDESGTLYAGGCVSQIWRPSPAGSGRVIALRNLAQWNGSEWAPVGPGPGAYEECVAEIAVERQGITVALRSRFDEPRSRIVHWNGSDWSESSADIRGVVRTWTRGHDRMVVAGRLEAVGDESAFGVVSLNTRTGEWRGLGTAGRYGVSRAPQVVTADETGAVYIGGPFTTAGRTLARGIARWDGRRWQPFGEGLQGGTTVDVYDIAPSESFVYVSGSFSRAGDIATSGLAAWDRSKQRWMPLPGAPSGARALAASGGDLWVAAGSGVWLWDGSSWEMRGGFDGVVHDILIGRNGVLYAVGDFETVDGVPARGVAALHDNQWWRALGEGQTGGRLLATREGGFSDENPFHGDGTEVIIAGRMRDSFHLSGLAFWDSRWGTWGFARGGLEGPRSNCVAEVSGLAILGSAMVIGGTPKTCLEHDWALGESLLRRWDGASWHDLDPDFRPDAIHSLAATPDGLFVVGDFPGGVTRWGPPVTVAAQRDAPRQPSIEVFPNPAGDVVFLEFGLEFSQEVSIAVFDVLGRKVVDLANGRLARGTHRVRWASGGFARGSYLVRIQRGQTVDTRPAVVAH